MLIPLVGALLVMAPVQAQPASPESPEIIVQGVRDRDRAIHDFVGAVTPAPLGGQLRRFQFAACPAATGLSDAQNRQVVNRLRQVAGAVGMPLGAEGCGPNVVVIIVPNKEEFLTALRRKYPAYFSDPLGRPVHVPNESGPAVAWHIESMLNADGVPASVDNVAKRYSLPTTDSSRLRAPGIPHFIGAYIVIESKALAGLTTTQLADYSALRLYANTDPAKLRPTASSILGVLDAPMGTAVPETMTAWDLAFLKGLYKVDDRSFVSQQRAAIERGVRRENR